MTLDTDSSGRPRAIAARAMFCFVGALAFVIAASAPLRAQWQADVGIALDTSRAASLRMRHLAELGRTGTPEIVSDLRVALRDERPEIRRETLKAMMRIGSDPALRDLAAMVHKGLQAGAARSGESFDGLPTLPQEFKVERTALPGELSARDGVATMPEFPDLTPEDTAWAIRAMGQSGRSTEAMPHLIASLQAHDPRVREAALGSLQRVTGFTMGATRDFLMPLASSPSVAEQSGRWQEWWKENEARSPEQWRLGGLRSALAKDRAAAARALVKANQSQAVPDLIEALKQEANPLNTEGTSGVRYALAKAIGDLTGVKPEYGAYRTKDQTEEQWREQHDAAIKRWEEHVEAVVTKGESVFDVMLRAPEPKTRSRALRELRRRTWIEQRPMRYLDLMESDPSSAVRSEAYLTLVRCTCVAWPYEYGAESELRGLQLARWRDWLAEFAGKREQGAVTVFQSPGTMRWGSTQPGSDEARRLDYEKLLKALPTIRSRTTELIVIERLQVSVIPLRDAFDDQLALLSRVISNRSTELPADLSGVLQRNLARAFGAMKVRDSAERLVKRIELGRSAELQSQLASNVLAAARDDEVIAACCAALGNLGSAGIAGLPLIAEMVDHRKESSLRVRANCAYALAGLNSLDSLGGLYEALQGDPQQIVKIAAAEALGMIALANPVEKDRVLTALSAVQGRGHDAERLKRRCREIVTIVEGSRRRE